MGYWHEPKYLPGSVFRAGTIKDGLSETQSRVNTLVRANTPFDLPFFGSIPLPVA